MRKTLTILACALLFAAVVPGSSADPTLRGDDLLEPQPVFHPALGSTAGCELTGTGVYWGYLMDPPAQDNDCSDWQNAENTWSPDTLSWDCSDYCVVSVWGQTDTNDFGDVWIECLGAASGFLVLTDDPLANLLLQEDDGGCFVYYWGAEPDSWATWQGYMEDWNFVGNPLSANVAENWLDGFLDSLL